MRVFSAAQIDKTVSEHLIDTLSVVTKREGATLFMTLLAAFAVVLYAQSRQAEILIGTPVAGRNRAQLEDLIGCFINTLVLRLRVDDDILFKDLVSHIKEVTLGALANQNAPFERVVEQLRLPRELRQMPLFQVMFSLHNTPYPRYFVCDRQYSYS